MHMGDSSSMMMLAAQHHIGISANNITKEEKDDNELASYTHDLMSNSSMGLSFNEGGEDDDHHFNNPRDGFHDLPPPSSSMPSSFSAYDPLLGVKGMPQEAQPIIEPTIPRLMQMQMEKYLHKLYKLIVCSLTHKT